ncbi:MAG TPA: Mov34/MPN/PAD-1 family protein [Ktedonobacteraceae bacterium]|nr:Mov34/MPN/PAD-1 family protein [Ktedonobacteraceae bacterium]
MSNKKTHNRHLQVSIAKDAHHMLLNDVYSRRQMEACGVLLGERASEERWHVTQVQPLQNIAASPTYFEFAPEELLAIELTYPDQIVGVYHSHPTGYARASKTDQQNMQRVNQEQSIPWVWLIVCGPFEQEETEAPGMLAYYHDEIAGLQQVNIIRENGP